MKIEVNIKKLIYAVNKADRVVNKNSSLPVLSCLVLETGDNKIFIKATNLEIGLKKVIPANVLSKGKVAIPSNILVSYLNNLNSDGNLLLEVKENVLFISGKKTETKINTLSVEDFPDIPDTSSTKGCKVSVKELVEGLKAVWYAASTSNMKPELSSVYIYSENNNLVFVATDSFRLAEKKINTKINSFENVLIPQKNVLEIIRVFEDIDGNVNLNFEEDKISFKIKDDIYIITRIIDGNFPDYKQIIPKESKTEITVLKNDLQNTLKISNIFTNNFNQVNFKIDSKNNTFEILSKNSETGESRNNIDSKIEGESIEINFNQKYILDSFSSITTDSVLLKFNGNGKPMVIKGINDNSFQYLVMPLNK